MIGIVVLNYETWEATFSCIKSIVESEIKERYQIYLVDNASVNEMPKKMHQYVLKKEIVLLRAKENKGYSAGNNLGIKKALEDKCTAILITNNDIIFQSSSIQEMYDFLFKNENIGIVGPKVVGMDGKCQPSAISRRTEIKEIFQIYTVCKLVFRKQWRSYFSLDKNWEDDFQSYHVSGCCFMMSRACAELVTPLDEEVFLYNEELILGIAMEKTGFQTWYHPESVVEHHHGYTTKRMKPFMYQCIGVSELYYCFHYLKEAEWKIWILYRYRLLLYWIRSRRSTELKNNWINIKVEMKKRWNKYKELACKVK